MDIIHEHAERLNRATTKRTSTVRKLPNGKYRVLSESGKDLGTYPSKEKADKRLQQIEYFKHNAQLFLGNDKYVKHLPEIEANALDTTYQADTAQASLENDKGTIIDVMHYLIRNKVDAASVRDTALRLGFDFDSDTANWDKIQKIDRVLKAEWPHLYKEDHPASVPSDLPVSTNAEDVHNPNENQDDSPSQYDYGHEKSAPGIEQEYDRDYRKKRYPRKKYPTRGQVVKLTANVWVKADDQYALRKGSEEDNYILIPRGSIGVVTNVVPGFNIKTKAICVKFGPKLEASFTPGRGYADPRSFLKRAQVGELKQDEELKGNS